MMKKMVVLAWGVFNLLIMSGSMARAATRYVSTNGLHISPFTTPATASTNIQIALDVSSSGDTIEVASGVYDIGAPILISNGVTLRGVNGPNETIIRRVGSAYFRIMQITNTVAAAGAVVEGLTLTGGRITSSIGGSGAGIWVQTGLVHNCIISNNWADSNGSYGGVHLTGGIVSNCVITRNISHLHGGGVGMVGPSLLTQCVISSNKAGMNQANHGGGVHLNHARAMVEQCRIFDNEAGVSGTGGGIYQQTGTNRNNLIYGNRAGSAGGLRITGGTAAHCTIVGNRGITSGMGNGITQSGGTVINCIVIGNRPRSSFASDQAHSTPNIVSTGGTLTYTCSFPAMPGEGNMGEEPVFVDPAAFDFRLMPGSPGVDRGLALADIARDFDGQPRSADGTGDGQSVPDMGAHELPNAPSGSLRVGVQAEVREGLGSLSTTLRAVPAGSDTNLIWYGWDFDGDGIYELTGPNLGAVQWTFGPGFYTVRLTVSNTWESTACSVKDLIRVSPPIAYVSPNGGHVAPYTNWNEAATNLQAALDVVCSGAEVRVSAGAFPLTQPLDVASGVWLRGAGTNETFIHARTGATTRVMNICSPGAVVENVSITNGYITASDFVVGAGVYLENGVLRNTLITRNRAATNADGGGLYIRGGVLSNCVVSANTGHTKGNGLWLVGGTVRECLIMTNAVSGRNDLQGGGVYMTGGLLMNSIIRDNAAGLSSGQGGGVCQTGGQIVNCTIAHNTTGSAGSGGGLVNTGGGVTNTIIAHNTRSGPSDNIGGSHARIGYSCSPDLTNGINFNLSADPGLADPDKRDYRLLPASPCVDAGLNLSFVTIDYAGSPRPMDGNNDSVAAHDIGAYEAPDASSGPLRVDFDATPRRGLDELWASFTVTPMGAETNLIWYGWDFDADGTDELTGADLGSISRLFPPGLFSVRLTVSNSIGETASMEKSAYIHVAPSVLFVSPSGTHTAPFTNWVQAATNPIAALNLALSGSTILVTNGVYPLSQTLILDKDVIIRGVGEGLYPAVFYPGATSGERRIASLSSTGAVLENLSLTNGFVTGGGGAGVFMTAGLIRRCRFFKNWASNNTSGGGLLMSGGRVEECLFEENRAHLNGGGAVVNGGIVERSIFYLNSSGINVAYHAGGVYVNGGIVRNCLITGNESGSSGCGGGARVDAGLLESSTVVGNRSGSGGGGGVFMGTGGGMTNCIVFDNVNGSMFSDNVMGTLTRVGYSCAPELPHDPAGSGTITNDPGFLQKGVNYGLAHTNGNYRIDRLSPCANTGLNRPWMVDAVDLDGNSRIRHGRVDMGAYEARPPTDAALIIIR